MATIRIVSAGAAQAVVEKIGAEFGRETGCEVGGVFGAVGAMKARLVGGETPDVIILTAALIDELAREGHVVAGSRVDLGRVGTGVAVRAGAPLPDVSNARVLRANLLAAATIACPDPAIATAGKVVMAMLGKLGIVDGARGRLKFFPNGYAAMGWLAESYGMLEVGITQVTEIRANPGVTLVAPLPAEFQLKTVYSAGLAARSGHPEAAQAFIARLGSAAARPVLAAAGYELD